MYLLNRHVVVALRPANLGLLVVLRNMDQRPELNGQRGVAVAHNPETKDYTIRLAGDQEVLLKANNLVAGERCQHINLAGVPGPWHVFLELGVCCWYKALNLPSLSRTVHIGKTTLAGYLAPN